MKALAAMIVFLAVTVLGQPITAKGALAGEPTEQLRKTVDAVIEILRDKELKKPQNAEKRRQAISRLVRANYDFDEMARRSLGIHWRDRTPEERKEFVSLYTDLLEKTYIKKIERYEDEEVVYVNELVDGTYSVVKTKIVSKKGVDIPVDYRLRKQDGKWEVYDIIVEGVSLVNNYRTQFYQIMRTGGYEELIKRLRAKAL